MRNMRKLQSGIAGSTSALGLAVALAGLAVGAEPARAAAGLASDDFNLACGVLGAEWTVVDPLGDAGFAIGGVGTTDAQLEIAVPSGTAHDLWDTGALSPRLMQAASDEDFEVEVKWDAAPVDSIEGQGIVVEGAGGQLLRFDFYANKGKLRVFAAEVDDTSTSVFTNTKIGAPTSPLYMRVARSGDLWTQLYSFDGASWTTAAAFTRSLVVTGVGLHALNAGDLPAHTVVVDYFFDTSAPIVPEDGSVSGGGGERTLSAAAAGPGSGVVDVDPDQASYACGSSATLTATPDPGSVFAGWSGAVSSTENPLAVTVNDDLELTAAFDLLTDPPVVSDIQVVASANAATVSWTTDYPAESQVDFGETSAYGSSAGDTALVTSHSLELTGLSAETDYHYQIVSVSSGGLVGASGDLTFATPAVGSDPSGLVSDDFNVACGTLGSAWSVVDPLGDASIDIVGVGTTDAHLRIALPAGTEHNAWEGGADVPRVVQSANDTDLSVEVKFDSPLGQAVQGQGLLFESAAGDFVRFDFYFDGTDVRAFAADVTGGVGTTRANAVTGLAAPQYLRVQRVGDDWTHEVSADGVAWTAIASFTHALALDRVGVFALNAGASPAHDALVDSFFVSSAPIVPEDGSVSGDASPKTLSLGAGPGGSATATPDAPTYVCGETVTLEAIPDPGYGFVGWSGDVVSTANPLDLQMTDDRVVQADFALQTAPVISGLQVAPGTGSATITWETDVPATTVVDYGTDLQYLDGPYSDVALVTSHSAVLTGLTSGQEYHFEARSVASSGLSSGTGDQTFTTLVPGSDPSGIVSDDFNAACGTLAAQWTAIDPLGDAGFALTGAGTADAYLEIDVPPGVAHDLGGSSMDVPRVMQPVADTDFQIEAKFDSPLSEDTQGQGLLIQEAPGEFLRFELFHNGRKLRAFAAAVSGGSQTMIDRKRVTFSAPYWLRLTRSGDDWLYEVSGDGLDYTTVASVTLPLAVTEVGAFALSADANPGMTAQLDSFFSTASPVVPEDGASGGGGPKALSVATTGPGSVVLQPDQASYACGQSVTLTAVPDFGANFGGWRGDFASSQNPLVVTMNDDVSLAADFVLDTTPPSLSNVSALAGATTAVVRWDTSEPATSRVDYGTTSAYGDSESSSTQVTSHSVALTGLAPETLYHFEITSVDNAGLPVASGDLSFTTGADGGPPGIASDDFQRDNLDVGRWSVVDPVGDAAAIVVGAGSADAAIRLSLPAGVDHAITSGANDALRIVQSANDTDLRLQARLDAPPTDDFQAQGLLVQESGDRFLVFDLHSDGVGTSIGATAYVDGGVAVELEQPYLGGFPVHLRVERLGDTWLLSHSPDGSGWTALGGFERPLAVAEVGLFAENGGVGGAPAPAFAAEFDYFFDADAPVGDEDGSLAPDVLPPLVQAVQTVLTDTTAVIQWVTDEPGDSRVDYGTDATYALGTLGDDALATSHSVAIPGLSPETLYHFRIISEDGLGQPGSSGDLVFTTQPEGFTTGPLIDVWYGDVQPFGYAGLVQPWVNVLGNVSDPDGVASLHYSLNGGPPVPLSQGPDTRRLADPGDFNADLATDDLIEGANTVVLTAVDGVGEVSQESVTVLFDSSVVAPLPTTIAWDAMDDLLDETWPIDGSWVIEGSEVRASQLDYDRLLGLGDLAWTDYEVEVPITVFGIDEGGFESPSNKPGIGMILRWPGHTIRNDDQPANGFFPLGAIGFLRFKPNGRTQLQIYGNDGDSTQRRFDIAFGTTYVFKMRVENVSGGGLYRFKAWEQGTPEPSEWRVTQQESPSDPQRGSVALVAHHVDALFGPVTVTPLP